jgi:N-methylhydantoinase B
MRHIARNAGTARPRAGLIRDPATFEVFKNAISGLADEMAITILRTAHSQIVGASMDFSAALCDAQGRVIAQANTIPVHLGSVPEAMSAALRHFGGTIKPGDVYVLNDPDLGGMHLPDIFAIMPVFADEQLLGFSVSVANHADVGGAFAGSMSVQSTSIFGEGIQIPPSRLIDSGMLNETFLSLILRNVREPELLRGDLDSQLSACYAGAQGMRDLATRYGIAGLRSLSSDLLDYSELLLREVLAGARPGTVQFADFLDDDGINDQPVPLTVAVTVSADGMLFDFTGSSPQVETALNATASFTKSACYTALQAAAGTEIPPNSGFYRPLSFVIPEASILQGRRPAPRGARGLTGHRLIDLVLGALAEVFPERVPASGDGGPNSLAMGIVDEDGTSRVVLDVLCGGWGARPDRDGVDGISPLGANLANTPVEEIELSGFVRIDGYGLLRDTGGPGRWRGGMSTFRDMTLLHDEGTLQVRSDRRRFLPYGLRGGRPGTPSLNILNPARPGERLLTTKPNIIIHRGDRHRHVTAGGGGHGDPLDRDPQRVLEDVLDDKVSLACAQRDYGVVIAGDYVDEDATRTLRARMRGTQ